MKRFLVLVMLAGCGGDDIERICTAMTECGVVTAGEMDTCVAELDAYTPDSATRALADCASCMDTLTCGDIASGNCSGQCGPLFSAINSTPGTTTGACVSSSTENYVTRSTAGELLVRLNSCNVTITPGAFTKAAGTTLPCGRFTAFSSGDCAQASGTVEIIDKGGRPFARGACSCSNMQVSFDVPFRITF